MAAGSSAERLNYGDRRIEDRTEGNGDLHDTAGHAGPEPRPAAVAFVTTEHFTLQGARSQTISESIGRGDPVPQLGHGRPGRPGAGRDRHPRRRGVLCLRPDPLAHADLCGSGDVRSGAAVGDRGPWLCASYRSAPRLLSGVCARAGSLPAQRSTWRAAEGPGTSRWPLAELRHGGRDGRGDHRRAVGCWPRLCPATRWSRRWRRGRWLPSWCWSGCSPFRARPGSGPVRPNCFPMKRGRGERRV